MKFGMKQVIKKDRDIELTKDAVNAYLEIDNITIINISKGGILRVYLDGLETLGIKTECVAKTNDGTTIVDVRKLLIQHQRTHETL